MGMRRHILRVVMGVFALGALGYLPFALAEERKSIEQMIEGAKTPADHEAIAAFYAEEARTAHQRSAEHKKLRDAYARSAVKNPTRMAAHCDTLTKKYEEIAKEYEALAKDHREMAKATKK